MEIATEEEIVDKIDEKREIERGESRDERKRDTREV